MKLLIENDRQWHYEIIESVIVKYNEILKINKETPVDIYMSICPRRSDVMPDFKDYICDKYPKIKFQKIDDYDYYINCTVFDFDEETLNNLDKNESNKKYISHFITKKKRRKFKYFLFNAINKK